MRLIGVKIGLFLLQGFHLSSKGGTVIFISIAELFDNVTIL